MLAEAKKEREEVQANLKQQEEINTAKAEVNEAMLAEITDKQKRIEAFKDRKQNSYYFYKKYLHNRMQELKGNIRVFCRLRPALEGVDDASDLVFSEGLDAVVTTPNFQSIEVNHIPGGKSLNSGAHPYAQKQFFKFDAVFGADSTQSQVFKEISELVRSAMDGYRVCIFSYGQTGSGKTFTMEGDLAKPENKGMIPRAVEEIFCHINIYRESGWTFTIECSFQEIYLENI